MVQVLLDSQSASANDQILSILLDTDDVSWKTMIFGLIQSEEMDPWDVDVSIIANKFLSMLKKLKEMDFRIGGKIVLASAVLLKLKSDKLMDEEIAALDSLINSAEEPMDMGFFEEMPMVYPEDIPPAVEPPKLVPRTPQPRQRKVSVYDLVEALEKVLDVAPKKKRPSQPVHKTVETPTAHIDISQVIKDVYGKINSYYASAPASSKNKRQQLTFSQILPSEHKQDKVLTFIPLLHLENQRKINVEQEEHFGEIAIDLLEQNADVDEMASIAELAK